MHFDLTDLRLFVAAAEAGSIPDRYIVLFVDTNPLAAVVVLAGTVCAVGAAVMLLRVAKGATRSSKYTTPAARREEIETEIFADYERRKAAEQNEAAVAEPGAARSDSAKPGTSGRADDPDPAAEPTPPGANEQAVARVAEMWRRFGSNLEFMEASHHDKVLAITSHLPHLIAYTIVGTATDLEEDTKSEVIKFSAGGFRDFTRIAASDPVMWRDVFLNNREAVLEIIQRFNEDLTALQRAIRWGEGDKLEELFTRTRAIRRGVIDAKQA